MDLIEDLNDVGLSWYYAVTGKKPPTTPAQPPTTQGTATISVGGNSLGLLVVAIVVAVVVAIIYFVAK